MEVYNFDKGKKANYPDREPRFTQKGKRVREGGGGIGEMRGRNSLELNKGFK
jgi:hypothetical protein